METPAIFVENLPVIGQVPLVFYLPQSPEKSDLKAVIEKYGGQVQDIHECFTYQICPLSVSLPKNNYFYGDVYSTNWILDSISRRTLLDPNEYLEFVNKEKSIKRIEFSNEKVKYTVREGLKIFELALANQGANSGATFWLKVERQNTIPRRTGDSMRAFWKLHRANGLETYLKWASRAENDVRYSHVTASFPTAIVKPFYEDN